MRTLYIMVGAPGSDKTTYAKTLDGVRVSFDDIKEDLYGDANINGNPNEVSAEFRKRIWNLIQKNKSVIIDYMGLTRKSRKHFIKTYGSYFDEIVAVHINTPVEKCIEQDSKRTRHVPIDVIRSRHNTLVAPSESEGFNKIITVEN